MRAINDTEPLLVPQIRLCIIPIGKKEEEEETMNKMRRQIIQ